MRHRFDLERAQLARAADAQRVVILPDLAARGAQLGGDGFHMLGDDVVQRHIALGDGRADHIAAGLDLIRDDRILAAVQFGHAVDLDHIGAGAAHIRAHHIQEVGQIDDMRFTGHIFEHRGAFGQHRRQHGVHRRADRDGIKEHMRTVQRARLDMDLAVLDRILRPQRGKRLEVLVDGARAQVAAARHRHLAGAEPPQQRAQEIIACAHLAGKFVGDLGADDVGGIDLVCTAADHADAGPQLAEDLEGRHHITDAGQVFDQAFIRGQNRGRQNGHGCVFRAADIHIALQRVAPADHKFFQRQLSFVRCRAAKPFGTLLRTLPYYTLYIRV